MSHMQATAARAPGRTASLPELADRANALLHGSTAGNKVRDDRRSRGGSREPKARYVSAGHIDTGFGTTGQPLAARHRPAAPPGLLPGGASYEQTLLDIPRRAVGSARTVSRRANEGEEEFGEERMKQTVRS
jgi:hypothetical protein